MEVKLKIGTRGSDLALWQANYTKEMLARIGVEAELEIIKTKGDKVQNLSFDKIEGKGFFTKEIEDALISGDIDMAVHSMKDLPTSHHDQLVIAAVSERADPSDWLLIRKDASVKDKLLKLREGATVGTSSARRKAQLLDFRSDIQIEDIRGNVPTRISKLRDGSFDAIILAAAGITRLNLDLEDLEIVKLNPKEFIPAPAQGVLAFQTARDDIRTRRILKNIHTPSVSKVTNIERKVLQLLDGGCHMPLGVYCTFDPGKKYNIWVAKSKTWDSQVKYLHFSSSTSHNFAQSVVDALNSEE